MHCIAHVIYDMSDMLWNLSKKPDTNTSAAQNPLYAGIYLFATEAINLELLFGAVNRSLWHLRGLNCDEREEEANKWIL